MSTTTHTPGPWTVLDTPSDYIISANAYGNFATCHKSGRRENIVTDYANARLIAAAPELLAALKDVMAEADFGDSDLEAKCRAAIAKAEGATR